MPFAVADYLNKLCCMFPDSKVAAEFASARTKNAAVVTHVPAPAINEPVIKACHLYDSGDDKRKNILG